MAKKPGYVYVAEDTSKPSHYKIGQSTDPDARERTLQGGGLAKTINIIKRVQVDDMDAVERAFHEILRPHRVGGEWFNINLDQVTPMFNYLGRLRAAEPSEVEHDDDLTRDMVPGAWHEDGWKMHCGGATQAAIAERFGVTQGAVVAMKQKMRSAGRGYQERDRRSKAVRREERSPSGTPQSSFRQPIVDVLTRLGGRARAKDVLNAIEDIMSLSSADRRKLRTGQVVWKNKAQWARQQLKDDGVLKRDSARGWWELA